MMDSKNNHPDKNDKQLILLKAHKKKLRRQEYYLLFEKENRATCGKNAISLSSLSDKNKNIVDINADIIETLKKRNLHKALNSALLELDDLEREMIDECFFYVGNKKESYEELGRKHNQSKQAYYNKLLKILHKLRRAIEQSFDEF